MVFFVRHVLHLTSQHQWKVHAQRSTTVTSCVRYPRPQHIRSQPSTPIDVSLHWRPCVPRIPSRRFFSQNPGDCSKYTRSLGVGGLWSGLYGFSENLYLFDKNFIRKLENFQYSPILTYSVSCVFDHFDAPSLFPSRYWSLTRCFCFSGCFLWFDFLRCSEDCCWLARAMHHRNDLSVRHQWLGNSAIASSRFWQNMIPTSRGIYTLLASPTERAVKINKNGNKLMNSDAPSSHKIPIKSVSSRGMIIEAAGSQQQFQMDNRDTACCHCWSSHDGVVDQPKIKAVSQLLKFIRQLMKSFMEI